MTRRPAHLLAAAVTTVVVALAVSGCSGGGAAVDPTATEGPLDRYLSVLSADADADEEQKIATTAAIEEAVAACMTALGFDYTPEPYNRLDQSFPGDWRPDDRDWVELYGYGQIDFPALDEVIADNATASPNDAYYASLSASDQQAYSELMWGPQLTQAQIDANFRGERTWTWEDQGCWGQGRHEVLGDDPQDDPDNAAIAQALYLFRANQFDAPEYAEIDADWADCMADAGHPGFERQGDAQQSIVAARDEITSAEYPDAVMGSPLYDDLLETEIELARADLDCREQVDYRARSLAIQSTQEEQFIADHRAELDALLADAEQGG